MELDDAYANGAYIAGAEGYPPRWAIAAKGWVEVQSAKGLAKLDIAYGSGARQTFDLFGQDAAPKGLMVFVHGGYWMAFDKSSWSHLAAGAHAHGYAVAVPSYDRCPDVRISDITRQIARAIEVAASMVAGPIVLAGHSAGGHLVARMACKGVLADTVAARLQKVVPISPVGDLRPLLQTSMNEKLRLDMAEAIAESPTLAKGRHDVSMTTWVGAKERPVFIEQARDLAEAWGAEYVVAKDHHHFDVIDPLADPESDLVKILLG